MSNDLGRNRQAVRSQQMLRAALVELLKQKPYDKISIADIVRQSNLTRPTFYAHYEAKDDLLEDIVAEIFSPYMATLQETARLQRLTDDVMIEVHTRLFEEMRQYIDIYQVLRRAGKGDVILAQTIKLHTIVYEHGISRKQPEMKPSLAELFIHQTSSTSITVLNYWIDHGMSIPTETMAKILTAMASVTSFDQIVEEYAEYFT